ncbi:hypothetical protein Dimus_032502 [Dionaea muscipula]
MEECGNLFEGTSNTVRKKRSHPFRRPRLDSEALHEGCGISSMSSTPPWDDLIKGCSDENNGVGDSSSRKEINLNQCVSRFPAGTGEETERPSKRSRKEDVRLDVLNANNDFRDGSSVLNHKRSSEGVLAPANWKCPSRGKEYSDSQSSALAVPSELGQDGTGNETKVKKVTLKVGGVTHTIDPNSASKSSRASEASVQRPKLTLKVNSQVDRSLRDKRGGLQGIPWKDFTGGGLTLGNEGSSMGRMSGKRQSGKQGNKLDPVRKSRRAPKKRVMDGEFDDDDEIRYLEKVKNSKFTSGFKDDDDESGRKHRRLSKVSGMYGETMESKVSSKFVKEGKRKTPFGDTDYEEEEDPISDGEVDGKTMKKVRKEAIDSATEPKRETTLMTRQKALQSCKDPSASGGLIEFPNGLSPAPPRKKKAKLTDVEQQVKKSEAAQRRRMQNEKAERETQAEAIRKILGQDSNKQKREKRKKKRQEELAQERAADALARASNSIRLVMGPNGTTVTFPNAMGLPNIFNSKTNSYPPPRDKCVGPSCSNPYKYRDSKTKLPLCSLQCYKQVQGNNMQSGEAPIGDIPAH